MAAKMGFPSGGEANQGWKLYLTSLIMVLSAGLIVVARIVTRLWTANLKSDDYAIITSLAFSISLSVAIQLAIVHGYGQHKTDLSKDELQTCLKFFWIAQTPYKIVVCLNKTSVILLYLRIFISQHFRWLCYSALAIVVGSGIATVFATIFQCVPLERSWNKNIDGTCIDSSAFWLANAVLNISTDVVVLALPIHEIFKLQLKLQEKIMLCSVFLLGGIVTITSILRVTAVANSVRNQQDQTWNFIQRGIWTLIEANLGIICACLIVLKQLVKKFFVSIFSTSRTDPSTGYVYRYGSGGTDYENGSRKRDQPSFTNRHHFRLDDTAADEEMNKDVYLHRRKTGGDGVWVGGETFRMTSLAYRSTSEDGRKNDEMDFVSRQDAEQGPSPSSVESVEILTGWPLPNDLGITKKVDFHVSSRPSAIVDQ